ncbi:hypothetical protein [Bifidobacterium canis]|uniref:Uncharacterized protein n=1 Tax=Bifidobacterium canis TaxID=2610880 RepID=A0A7K1J4H4_9BIFI|nr:hypothetical protein [Bifidobacterium canis]MUH59441.1 hypothetical protein [Bifidobacterium canis]
MMGVYKRRTQRRATYVEHWADSNGLPLCGDFKSYTPLQPLTYPKGSTKPTGEILTGCPLCELARECRAIEADTGLAFPDTNNKNHRKTVRKDGTRTN